MRVICACFSPNPNPFTQNQFNKLVVPEAPLECQLSFIKVILLAILNILKVIVMVQLTPNGQMARAVGERGSESTFRPRSHHNWGARFGRKRVEMKLRVEPTNLHELEDLAKRSVEVMGKHGPTNEKNFDMAMDLLRQQYNLVSVV